MNTHACVTEAMRVLHAHTQPEDRFLVGVSGGVDSMVLLHVMQALRPGRIAAAHLHHGIRGQDADADARLVEATCRDWGIPYYFEQVDVPALAAREKRSVEDAARSARYAFFERLQAEHGCSLLVTAHHLGDQAETILLHLLRGTGLGGLCGMREARNGLLRPFLGLDKAQIMEYAAQACIPYRTDATNFSASYTRNKIRLELLPQLRAYNPSVERSLLGMAGLLQEDEALLEALAQSALDEARAGPHQYRRSPLAALPRPLQSRAVRLALQHAGALYGMQQPGIERVCALLTARTGACAPLPHGKTARVVYELLEIAPDATATLPDIPETPLCIPGNTVTPQGTFHASFVDTLQTGEGPFCAYFDLDALPKGIVVRTRRPGDRFHPLGAPGARKLKAYLIDKKIPQAQRNLPLLAAGNTILFFPGTTSAHPVRVTPATKRILRITFAHTPSPPQTP